MSNDLKECLKMLFAVVGGFVILFILKVFVNV